MSPAPIRPPFPLGATPDPQRSRAATTPSGPARRPDGRGREDLRPFFALPSDGGRSERTEAARPAAAAVRQAPLSGRPQASETAAVARPAIHEAAAPAAPWSEALHRWVDDPLGSRSADRRHSVRSARERLAHALVELPVGSVRVLPIDTTATLGTPPSDAPEARRIAFNDGAPLTLHP